MPYRSNAQRRKFHALLEQGKISPATVKEFDQASEGMKLPERIGPKPRGRAGNGQFGPQRTTRTRDHRRSGT